ncbi:probable C-mannosyltransferase DPY19L1 [Cimex lectularius]|uniref:C-mannosyltransferase DPY19L1 n=1 Tax=Cimex lectularius TaxID=79782 RepID=A0A8I6SJP6_CIMLE|nr:probable C-mannosyltransferase DPY19L1 [Cimex lectularius]
MAVRKRDKASSQSNEKQSAPVWHRTKNETHRHKSLGTGNKTTIARRLLIAFLACTFGLLHTFHVAILFENDRHFSHLSTLEREMTFRSEMGMYYSYYKTIVEAPSFLEGFMKITHDNITEYPSVINTLERFNLFPEVFLGCLFRIFDSVCESFGIVGNQCWEVVRGNGLSTVFSCVGIRQPEFFYLHFVWICAGFTTSILFIYGFVLSDSIVGGLISVMCFFYNHGECTRVQWTPPLRESFAYPFCLLQMLCVTKFLNANKETHDFTQRTGRPSLQFVVITIVTSLCLAIWQFSQFLFATQVIAILILFMLGFVSRFSALIVLSGQTMAVSLTLFLMFGNELLLSSLLTCLLLSSLTTLMFLYPILSVKQNFYVRSVFTTVVTFSLAIVLKTRALTTNDDTHIINIIRSKISSFRDFHTLLYTCSAEFDFLGWEPIVKLTETYLIPLVITTTIGLFLYWVASSKFHSIDPDVVYNFLQLGAFTVMAVMIMRLKLFFTPHLCIIASLAASRKYFKVLDTKFHFALLALFIACMKYRGIMNLVEQHNILGEYSNVDLEELLGWISESTPPNAVFAGPMPITAAILLSTRRPIVNHPHYEDSRLRERTKKVYTAFSRKPPEDVFKIISSLEVDYLVISESWCFGQSRAGCGMTDIWDIEDPKNRGRPPTCHQLLLGNFPFHLAFSNEEYAVLMLQPPYVELKGFNKY